MAAKIIVPEVIGRANLLSATSSAGARPLTALPAVTNVGSFAFSPLCATPAGINELITIVDPGDAGEATYTASPDGGNTTKGRKADTAFDGNGAAERVVQDDTADIYTSRPVLYDDDGDGIPDRVLLAIIRTQEAPDSVDIKYTTALDGAGAWDTLATDVLDGEDIGAGSDLSLLVHKGVLYLFVFDTANLSVRASYDGGRTFGAKTTIANGGPSPDTISLASGKMMVAYVADDGSGNLRVYCKTSSDGVTWTATRKAVSPSGTVDYGSPSIVQDASGKVIIFYIRETTTWGAEARQTTAADPAASAAVWATYSETLWNKNANDISISATIAPDGTIYTMVGRSLDLHMSKWKAGDASYPEPTNVYNPAGSMYDPKLATIGGAIWCVAFDSTYDKVVLVIAKYWADYNETTAPASWTGGSQPQYLHDGLWVVPGGAAASADDTFTIEVAYDYGAERMFIGTPKQPAASAVDGVDWYAVFSAGPNARFILNHVLSYFNGHTIKVQLSNTNDEAGWETPLAEFVVSHVRRTIASQDASLESCQLTLDAGTMVAHVYGGRTGLGELTVGRRHRLRFSTSGESYLVSDNTPTKLWCQGNDISNGTGDIQVLSPRAWVSGTAVAATYLRVFVPAQQTPEGRYEMALSVGLATDLPSISTVLVGAELVGRDVSDDAGLTIRRQLGGARRKWSIAAGLVGADLFATLIARLTAAGQAPVAVIPRHTNANDWSFAWTPRNVQFNWPTTMLELVEQG